MPKRRDMKLEAARLRVQNASIVRSGFGGAAAGDLPPHIPSSLSDFQRLHAALLATHTAPQKNEPGFMQEERLKARWDRHMRKKHGGDTGAMIKECFHLLDHPATPSFTKESARTLIFEDAKADKDPRVAANNLAMLYARAPSEGHQIIIADAWDRRMSEITPKTAHARCAEFALQQAPDMPQFSKQAKAYQAARENAEKSNPRASGAHKHKLLTPR